MIYLFNKTEAQSLLIPTNNLTGAGEVCVFSLVSTVERKPVYSCQRFFTLEAGYALISVTLPAGLADGEYEYILQQDGIISNGLAIIGERPAVIRPADAENTPGITFKQSK